MPNIRGISYPLAIANGALKVSTDIDLLRESIYSVLETVPSERVLNYTYGTPNIIFDAVPSFPVILELIRQSLETQIFGVDEFNVTGDIDDEGVGRVKIEWSVEDLPQPPIQYQLAL